MADKKARARYISKAEVEENILFNGRILEIEEGDLFLPYVYMS